MNTEKVVTMTRTLTIVLVDADGFMNYLGKSGPIGVFAFAKNLPDVGF